MSIQDFFTEWGDLEKVSESTSTKGEVTATWETVIPQLKGKLQPLNSRDRLEHAKANRETTHKWFCETKVWPIEGTVLETVPDIIKGTQTSPNPAHRLKVNKNGIDRYFEIEGQFDTYEARRLTVLVLRERDIGWIPD